MLPWRVIPAPSPACLFPASPHYVITSFLPSLATSSLFIFILLRTLALFQKQERAPTLFPSSVSALFAKTPGVGTPSPYFTKEPYDPEIR